MILEQNQAAEIKQLIESAADVAVCLPMQPTPDLVLSAAGLGLGLQSKKRQVWFSGGFDKVGLKYPHQDQVSTESGNRDLVVELPLGEDLIERISTVSVGDKMRIIIEPKEKQGPIKKEAIKLTYQGLKVDVLIVVGAAKLDDLGEVYDQNRLLFQEVPIIHIHFNQAMPLGRYNIKIDSQPMIADLPNFFDQVGLSINSQGADVWLWGLRYLTGNFKPGTPAMAFKSAAWLMEQGAKESGEASAPTGLAARPWPLPSRGKSGLKPISFKGSPFAPSKT